MNSYVIITFILLNIDKINNFTIIGNTMLFPKIKIIRSLKYICFTIIF